MEFRKMVTITLCTRQQKRHWCIEQSYGLCGRGRGWEDLAGTLWNITERTSMFCSTKFATELNWTELNWNLPHLCSLGTATPSQSCVSLSTISVYTTWAYFPPLSVLKNQSQLTKIDSSSHKKAGGEGDDREWDGWMASPIQWKWVWASSWS